MGIYPPSTLNTSYQGSASLVALFGTEGITFGFGEYSNIPGDPNFNADPFSSTTRFWAYCIDRGFFTGSTLKRYYTPAQAASLFNAPAISYSENGTLYTINQIEYRMRSEGVTTGYFASGGTIHNPGDDTCTILENLSTDGYMTGVIAQVAPVEGGFADTQCTDGRDYNTCCISLWNKVVNGLIGGANVNWQAAPAGTTFTVTFSCPVTVLFTGGANNGTGFRFYMDGVRISGAGGTATVSQPVYPPGNAHVFNVAAGTHVFTFDYCRDGLAGSNLFGNAVFVAFAQGGLS